MCSTGILILKCLSRYWEDNKHCTKGILGTDRQSIWLGLLLQRLAKQGVLYGYERRQADILLGLNGCE